MSRVLEKNVKETLKNGVHEQVYHDISNLLSAPTLQEPLEIEILGTSHLLQDGESFHQDEQDEKCFAIPKLRIVQAFIVARQKLLVELADSQKARAPPSEDVLKCTAVMLLMDPEHLTAANARKRVIRYSIAVRHAEEAKNLLQTELLFLRSLLTSHLHRHTKSPTLWSHRRWVVDQARQNDLLLPKSLKDDLVDEIFVSAERHPRNYYAWSHARYLVNASMGTIEAAELVKIVSETKTWCFKHHDDVSGWMFLFFLLSKLHDGDRHSAHDTSSTASESIFVEVMTLSSSFRWRNESVWYFLRNIVASRLVGEKDREAFHSALEKIEKGASQADAVVLGRTKTWVDSYSLEKGDLPNPEP